jgi:hypothetical protein
MRPIVLLAAVAASVALLPAFADAEDAPAPPAFESRVRVARGDVLRYRRRQEASTEFSGDVMKQDVSAESDWTAKTVGDDGTVMWDCVTTTASASSSDASSKVAVESTKPAPKSDDAMAEMSAAAAHRAMEALVGRKVSASMDARGRITGVFGLDVVRETYERSAPGGPPQGNAPFDSGGGEEDDEDEEVFDDDLARILLDEHFSARLLESALAAAPQRPVKVGDAWEGTLTLDAVAAAPLEVKTVSTLEKADDAELLVKTKYVFDMAAHIRSIQAGEAEEMAEEVAAFVKSMDLSVEGGAETRLSRRDGLPVRSVETVSIRMKLEMDDELVFTTKKTTTLDRLPPAAKEPAVPAAPPVAPK